MIKNGDEIEGFRRRFYFPSLLGFEHPRAKSAKYH